MTGKSGRRRTLASDFYRCVRTLDSFTDGQAKLLDWDSDNMSSLVFKITANDGPYQNTPIRFKVTLPEGYPDDCPDVCCMDKVYHPNIDPYPEEMGNVCLSLFNEWSAKFGLDDVITGLMFLLYYPNIEDPLSPYFEPDMTYDDYLENVEKSLKGEEVDGTYFMQYAHRNNENDDNVQENNEANQEDEEKDLKTESEPLLEIVNKDASASAENLPQNEIAPMAASNILDEEPPGYNCDHLDEPKSISNNSDSTDCDKTVSVVDCVTENVNKTDVESAESDSSVIVVEAEINAENVEKKCDESMNANVEDRNIMEEIMNTVSAIVMCPMTEQEARELEEEERLRLERASNNNDDEDDFSEVEPEDEHAAQYDYLEEDWPTLSRQTSKIDTTEQGAMGQITNGLMNFARCVRNVRTNPLTSVTPDLFVTVVAAACLLTVGAITHRFVR